MSRDLRRSDVARLKARHRFRARNLYRVSEDDMTPRYIGRVLQTHWCRCMSFRCSKLRKRYGPKFVELRAYPIDDAL